MANKTLNTRQKQVFRAPQQTPVGRGNQQLARETKSRRGGAPAAKPTPGPVKSAE
jgi:hypothetical protein